MVHFAKHPLGLPVVTDMAIEAEHAYLPKYGLEWHSEPMSIWTNWLAPYRCGPNLRAAALLPSVLSVAPGREHAWLLMVGRLEKFGRKRFGEEARKMPV